MSMMADMDALGRQQAIDEAYQLGYAAGQRAERVKLLAVTTADFGAGEAFDAVWDREVEQGAALLAEGRDYTASAIVECHPATTAVVAPSSPAGSDASPPKPSLDTILDCTCPTASLMTAGCTCGAMSREKIF